MSTHNEKRELSDLYPVPKTYEQRAEDRKAAEERRLERLPKHIVLATVFKSYSILIALCVSIMATPLTLRFGLISAIFMIFLIGLMWFGFVIWVAGNIADSFQKLGKSANPLFAFYLVFFPPFAFATYKATAHLDMPFIFASITCLHFALTSILAKLIVRFTS